MTWYAHHIFVQAAPAALTALGHHPTLGQHVYWVRDVAAPDGLIVVRPVGPPSKSVGSWATIGGPPDVVVQLAPHHPVQAQTADVLVHTLKHVGLHLPAPFFVVHTRSFPWEKYNIAPPSQGTPNIGRKFGLQLLWRLSHHLGIGHRT